MAGFALSGRNTCELGHLLNVGPSRLEIVVKSSSDLDAADFFAATMSIDGLSFLKEGHRISKIESQVIVESRLILFHRQNDMTIQVEHSTKKVSLSMQGISSTDTTCKRQKREINLDIGNFIRLFHRPALQTRFLGSHG